MWFICIHWLFILYFIHHQDHNLYTLDKGLCKLNQALIQDIYIVGLLTEKLVRYSIYWINIYCEKSEISVWWWVVRNRWTISPLVLLQWVMWPTELLTSRTYTDIAQERNHGRAHVMRVTSPAKTVTGDSARLLSGTPDGNAKWKFREGREGKSEKAERIEAHRNSTRKRRWDDGGGGGRRRVPLAGGSGGGRGGRRQRQAAEALLLLLRR